MIEFLYQRRMQAVLGEIILGPDDVDLNPFDIRDNEERVKC